MATMSAIPAAANPRRNNVHRLQAKVLAAANEASADPVPLADPGDLQLYNFYKPALVAGSYSISTSQTVSYHDQNGNPVQQSLDAPVGQPIDVVAPQFAIDPNEIHSTYPPPGHADQ
jgi:hypothetical protein